MHPKSSSASRTVLATAFAALLVFVACGACTGSEADSTPAETVAVTQTGAGEGTPVEPGESMPEPQPAPEPEPEPEPEPQADTVPQPTHPGHHLVVHKAERRLEVRDGARLLASYRVGLGFAPDIDKRREGDGATPEGEYRVCVKNPQSAYLLSLGLDYPNPADAARALEAGALSGSDHDRIVAAHRRGVCPPWNTPLGGEIYIHGRGGGSDWTLGCVALDDDDIRVLYDTVRVGVPVSIQP